MDQSSCDSFLLCVLGVYMLWGVVSPGRTAKESSASENLKKESFFHLFVPY